MLWRWMQKMDAVAPLSAMLAGGRHMPMIAYGPMYLDTPVDAALIHSVMEAGYRHLVVKVENGEFHSSRATLWNLLKRERIDRPDIYITLIIETPKQIHEDIRGVVRESLECLGVKHVDLLLLQNPGKASNHVMARQTVMDVDVQRKTIRATWKLMEKLCQEGVTSSIGLSNFTNTEIEDLIVYTKCSPHVLMVPADWLSEQARHTKLLSYCKYRGFGLFVSLENVHNGTLSPQQPSPLSDICKRHQRTPYQLVTRRMLQSGASVLQLQHKSSDITKAFQVLDFGLSEKEEDAVQTVLPRMLSLPQPT